MRNLDEVILEIKNTPPISNVHQIEEFEKTTIYQDLQREWAIWVDDLREQFEQGSITSPEYFRGAVNMLKRVKETTGYIKDLLEQSEETES